MTIPCTPKVSILVPVFRVEKYLRQCVDSLVGQTFRDIEIILIDDGSDDACPQICDEYAARDARVRVIHKENSGYGASMNRGLDEARGDYIGIVESDDWVEPTMFGELYRLANENKVQVVRSNYFAYTDKGGDKLMSQLAPNECDQVVHPLEKTGVFCCTPAIWTCLYERRFLEEAGIRFLESPGASYQDVGFFVKVWVMAERAWLTQKAYHHYRCDHMESSVKSREKVFCVADEWWEIERYLEQYPERKRCSRLLCQHIKFTQYTWNLWRLEGEARAQFLEAFRCEFKEILKGKGLQKDFLSDKQSLVLMELEHPSSLAYTLRLALYRLSRLFVKSKVRNGKRTYSVLFGLLRYERELPCLSVSE